MHKIDSFPIEQDNVEENRSSFTAPNGDDIFLVLFYQRLVILYIIVIILL